MESVREYLESANSHLNAVEVLMGRGLYSLAVFHMHQALEFLLKALLVKQGHTPMKTHNLYILVRNLELDPSEKQFLRELTIHYYASRYPDARRRYGISREYYSDKKVRELLEKTKKLFNKLRKKDCKVDLGKTETGEDVYSKLMEWVRNLRKRGIKILLLAVIGSRAKGTWKPWSDIDILLIAENLPPKSIKRYLLLLPEDLDIDLRAYTPEEAKEALEKPDREFLDLIHYGKVIIGEKLYKKIEKEIKEKFNVKYDKELDTWIIKRKKQKT